MSNGGTTSRHSKKGRGEDKLSYLKNLNQGEKYTVELNSNFIPIGLNGAHLAKYISYFSRDTVRFPLTVPDWGEIEPDSIDATIRDLRVYFDFPEHENVMKWIKKQLNERWRTWKAKVKRKYFTPYFPNIEQCKSCVPPGVAASQWFGVVDYWSKDTVQMVAETNRRNKAKNKYPYCGGRVSMAQQYHDFQKKYGIEASRYQVWKKTRLRSDGTYVTEEAAIISEKCDSVLEQRRSENTSGCEYVDTPGPNDVFGSQMPPETRGRIRLMPHVSPKEAGFKKPNSGVISNLQNENNQLRKEVDQLKEGQTAMREMIERQTEMAERQAEIAERRERDFAALMALFQQQRQPTTSESSQPSYRSYI